MANKTLRIDERYQIRKGQDGTLLYSQDGVKWLTPDEAHIVDFDKLDVTVEQIEEQMQLLQDAIDLINSTASIVGSVESYADLLDVDTTLLVSGDSYIVLSDEQHGGGTSMYVWDGTVWTYVGPFGINLASYYTKEEVDALIAGVDTGVMSVNGKIGPAVVLGADDIEFTDGDTFQDKYDSGELKGEKGDQGDTAVVFQPEEPDQTDVLWVDTDDPLNLYMPAGGLAGRVLKKNSNADYDTIWAPIAKADVGLGNVDNTSDANKPVSTATQAALGTKASGSDLTTGLATKENTITAGTTSQYWRGDKTWQPTLDLPVSTATQTALNLKANLASPALTGTPTAPTQTANNNSTRLATTAYVDTADLAHVQATDPHPQYHNDDRGDARYAGQPYAVMAKAKFASLASSYGMLGKIFGNSGYLNDLQVYGESTQASVPTPDAPVPIVSTTGDVTVRSDTKNLMINRKTTGTTTTVNGVTFVVSSDGSITANGTATANATYYLENSNLTRPIRIIAGTTYTISGNPAVGSATTFYTEIDIANDDGTTNFISNVANTSQTTTASKNGWARGYVSVRSGYTATNLTFKPQLEIAPSATAYEKTTTSTQTLPLGSTQLRSLPNGVSDRIYKSGSSWFLEQNVGRRVFNGSEAWEAESGLTPGAGAYLYKLFSIPYDTSNNTYGASDRFEYSASYNWNLGRMNLNRNGARALWFASAQSTLASFKTWLEANNATIHFNLAVPITTEVTDPTLITALENIRTYQGVTNITASTPVSGSYGAVPASKSQMETADALKVNKAGDTMTGNLTISKGTPELLLDGSSGAGNASLRLIGGTANGKSWNFISAFTGNFAFSNNTTNNSLLIEGTAQEGMLRIMSDRLRTNGVDYISGTGFPNGVVSATVGSTYIDRAATNGAIEWKKATGAGNTGWVVSVGDTGWRNCNALLGVFWNTTGAFRLRRIGDVVYVRIADLSVAASPTGARNSLRSITDDKWPVGFRHESWGTTAFTQVGVAGFPGCITPSADTHDLGVRVFTALTSGNWAAGDNVGGHFDYPVTSGWPSTLPGTPL